MVAMEEDDDDDEDWIDDLLLQDYYSGMVWQVLFASTGNDAVFVTEFQSTRTEDRGSPSMGDQKKAPKYATGGAAGRYERTLPNPLQNT